MNNIAPSIPLWANRLGDLCQQISRDEDTTGRAEAWQIVYFNLSRYLRYHSARLGKIDPDDLADISSQKTLELMRKVDISSGPLADMSAERLPGFLSTVARNGLITHLKKAGRVVSDHASDDGETTTRSAPWELSPAVAYESREYARVLCSCVGELEKRARTLWFYRVCYDMPSKEIARHPRVRMAPSHVDVVLHRARRLVRRCMRRNGHDTDRMPPGTFNVLWETLHSIDDVKQEAT